MITYNLICDYCRDVILTSGPSAAYARKDARDRALIFKHGRNEYCKACIEKQKHLTNETAKAVSA